jgi:RNA polymerase sigma factor (sigma-70 family)
MQEPDDEELLRRYATEASDEAFAALVQRHLNFVYGVALRQVGNPHEAEEVTQAVFIILARKARDLRHGKALSSWLFQAARLTARNFIRGKIRRRDRNEEAHMQSVISQSGTETWTQIAPFLNEALGDLNEKEREAILLRYFEGHNIREVGVTMGISEDAAEKRVVRGLEKLRGIFAKRGVAVTTAMLVGAIGVQSSQAAPASLAVAIVAAAKGSAASAASSGLAHATMKVLAWAKAKTAVAYGAAIVVAGTVAVLIYPKHVEPEPRTVRAVIREPFSDTTKMSFDAPAGSLAIQQDGKILVGTTLFGFFVDDQSGTLGSYARGAFRLNPNGSLDRTFLCDVGRNSSAAQYAHVDVGTDGRILLSGTFTAVDEVPRKGYALLLANGKVDDSFEPWRGTTNGGLRAFHATWLTNGAIGILTGSVEGRLAPFPRTSYQLAATGKWIQPASNTLTGGFARPAGLVDALSSLGFYTRKTIDWQSTKPAARQIFHFTEPHPVSDIPFDGFKEPPSATDAAEVLRALFEEMPIEMCRYAVRLPDGGTVLAVRDTLVNGSLKGPGRLMKFDKNWKPDFTFTNFYEGDIHSNIRLKRQPDGKLLVCGLVGTMNGEEFTGLVRLNADGQIDRTFHCTTTNGLDGCVMDVAVQTDGRIVICGYFNVVNGVETPHIARLNSDGSIDTTFHVPFMTLQQFNRARFAKKLRVPVAHLAKALPITPPATTIGTNVVTEAVAPTVLINSMRLEGGTMTIQFTGARNQQFVLQAKESFDAPEWTNISTNFTSAGGVGMCTDTNANEHPLRFYRLATP